MRDGARGDEGAFGVGAGQGSHADALVLPDLEVQVPCGQDKHAEMLEDPSIGLYVFAAHALQADAPKKSLNSPAKQGVQAVTFVEELKVPGWQGTQGDPTKNPDCTT